MPWPHGPAAPCTGPVRTAPFCFNGGMSRGRTGLVLFLFAIPVILIIAVVAVLVGLHSVHSDGRWTAVTKACPTLDGAAAGALGMAPAPLADDNSRGAHDTTELRNCFYRPGGDTNNALQVTVSLYQGGILHDSHAEAVAAAADNPPAGFRPLGATSDDHRFGDRGPGSGRLVLISIVDNAQVRVQLYNRDKLANASDAETEALRAPMQSIADQAITNLG